MKNAISIFGSLLEMAILANGVQTKHSSLLSSAALAQGAAAKAYVGLFKDNAVGVIDTGTNKMIGSIPIPNGPHGMEISPDGKFVYVASEGSSVVSVIDTATDKVSQSIEVCEAGSQNCDRARVPACGYANPRICRRR